MKTLTLIEDQAELLRVVLRRTEDDLCAMTLSELMFGEDDFEDDVEDKRVALLQGLRAALG